MLQDVYHPKRVLSPFKAECLALVNSKRLLLSYQQTKRCLFGLKDGWIGLRHILVQLRHNTRRTNTTTVVSNHFSGSHSQTIQSHVPPKNRIHQNFMLKRCFGGSRNVSNILKYWSKTLQKSRKIERKCVPYSIF